MGNKLYKYLDFAEQLNTLSNVHTSIIDFLNESKLNALLNKVGLSKQNAEYLDKMFGGRSIWMGNKIIDHIKETEKLSNVDALKMINDTTWCVKNNEMLSYIRDYMVVGLNGKFDEIKNMTLEELYDAADEWHDELEEGEADINYVEKHDIIIDFRNSAGKGYYWAYLGEHKSEEEHQRMGHCGYAPGNMLFSLRSYTSYNEKFTKNRSHLTAAIDKTSALTQLKGAKNSIDHDPELYPYIFELLKYKNSDGEYLIKEICTADLDMAKFDDDMIFYLYEHRPTLIDIVSKLRLCKAGKIDADTTVKINISVDNIEELLSNCSSELYDRILTYEQVYEALPDWEYYFNIINKENLETIKKLVEKKVAETDEDIEGMNLKEVIEFIEYDDIIDAIEDAARMAEESAYYDDCISSIKSGLEEYGEVVEMDETGAVISIDLIYWYDEIINGFNKHNVCDPNDVDCIFMNYIAPEIETPYIRWPEYAHVDYDHFNELLKGELPVYKA